MVIDLAVLPEGPAYEKTYGLWLDVFEQVAMHPASQQVRVENPPASWVPLLLWLGAEVVYPREHFPDCDELAMRCLNIAPNGKVISSFTRTQVEVLSCWRPETVDALFKCDMQWLSDRARAVGVEPEFVVTTNGSFHRTEVLRTMFRCETYVPPARKVVLVPCSADKPYPSVFQQAVLDVLPKGWYMAVTSTVLGVVPHELALSAPSYDAGLPYHWRLFEQARKYFYRVPHDVVIAFTDFTSPILREAFRGIPNPPVVDFLLPVVDRFDYGDLTVGIDELWHRIEHWDNWEAR